MTKCATIKIAGCDDLRDNVAKLVVVNLDDTILQTLSQIGSSNYVDALAAIDEWFCELDKIRLMDEYNFVRIDDWQVICIGEMTNEQYEMLSQQNKLVKIGEIAQYLFADSNDEVKQRFVDAYKAMFDSIKHLTPIEQVRITLSAANFSTTNEIETHIQQLKHIKAIE